MPYAAISELPPAVREKYSERCQRVFMEAFNAADEDEATRFRIAHTAAGNCQEGKSMTDIAVKFVDGSDTLIRGLAIPFGGPFGGKDFDGEDFGPDTDFAFDWFPTGRPLLYDHGLDGAQKMTVQGRQIEHVIDSEGVWAQAQLDKSAKYHATVSRLINGGKLFFSSGAVPHLVETDESGHIKKWPWIELSLTPTPANPWAAVYPIKSTTAIDHITAAQIDVPGQLLTEALKALDSIPADNDDGLPDGLKFADLIDRLSVDGPAWVKARKDWFAKSGRVLSAATRSRLADHPQLLRQLADDLDELLSSADADKSAAWAAVIEAEKTLARSLGVPIPN